MERALACPADCGRRLRELSATAVVNDVSDAVGQFDVAIESVGGEVTTAAWHQLGRRGLLIWLGQAGGTPPALDFLDWDGATSVIIRKFGYLDSQERELTTRSPRRHRRADRSREPLRVLTWAEAT